MRMWNEIVRDILDLLWTALHTDKGVELLDELAQALGLPDFFPGVDGSQWDDQPKPGPGPGPGPGIPPVKMAKPAPKPGQTFEPSKPVQGARK